MSAILGVVKAGKFYVPMDPSAPPKRCTAILNHSTASLLVTNTQNLAKAELAATDRCKIINVDDLEDRPAAENPNLSLSADAFAYLVYTSGSTGEPKGIVQTHRYALYHVFEYVNSFRICPDDRLSLVFPWLFNGGIHIIHSALLSGAALFPVDVKTDGLNHLARLLVEEKITIYHSTATTLRQTLNLLDRDEKLQNLRLVRFGGDSVSAADIQLYKENFSARLFAAQQLCNLRGRCNLSILFRQIYSGCERPCAGWLPCLRQGDPVARRARRRSRFRSNR